MKRKKLLHQPAAAAAAAAGAGERKVAPIKASLASRPPNIFLSRYCCFMCGMAVCDVLCDGCVRCSCLRVANFDDIFVSILFPSQQAFRDRVREKEWKQKSARECIGVAGNGANEKKKESDAVQNNRRWMDREIIGK